jgi:VIT1/CCC1 family predicted Fe2+/Mn2+ transporter
LRNVEGPARYILSRLPSHNERHHIGSIGWLRAAVLGANDGILSTASLIIGVAAASPGPGAILVAGIAGLVAGSLSMAAGEYVSVSSQADTETADLTLERRELAGNPDAEPKELAAIYVTRGLDGDLARRVAKQLTASDALGAHARDELGISALSTPRPVQAAAASAASFAIGAALPLLTVIIAPGAYLVAAVAVASLAFLALLGAVGAWAGGARILRPALRVAFWGSLAMAATAGIGAVVGHIV